MPPTIEPRKPPTRCDNCLTENVYLTTNREAYGPHAADPDTRIYRCRLCRASVGCHDGTTAPMGYMADATTRQLRIRAHAAFDPLWRGGPLTRTKAYRMLAEHLGIIETACHIAELTPEQLHATIQFGRDFFSAQRILERRRRERQITRQRERNERDYRERKRHQANRRRSG